jgi:hypothetical protein
MPEFLVPSKYKNIFNDYDLSVIKADHRPAEPADLRLYRRQFIERVKSRYPNVKWLPPPLFETIRKIEQLTEEEFAELMGSFRFV